MAHRGGLTAFGIYASLRQYCDRRGLMSKFSCIAHFVLLAVTLTFISQPAYAYIDPGTGSAVTTAILGFFAAIAYTFRKYMYRFKDMIFGKRDATSAKGDSVD